MKLFFLLYLLPTIIMGFAFLITVVRDYQLGMIDNYHKPSVYVAVFCPVVNVLAAVTVVLIYLDGLYRQIKYWCSRGK